MAEKGVGEKSRGQSRSLWLPQDECSKEKDNSYGKDAHVTLLILTRAVGHANWKIMLIGIDGVDHEMVSVEVAHEQALKIGRGRWSISNQIIKHKKFKAYAKSRGRKALEEVNSLEQRTDEQNLQRILASFKKAIIKKACEIEKSNISTYQQEPAKIKKETQKISNDLANTLQDWEKSSAIHDLERKLKTIEVHAKTTQCCSRLTNG
ncbi:hypothetical protein BT96DRAFT_941200 [Gymnopus androsaceus JB14]|uniref:Uncharacterized protein n=1 Tax=Gymnopus androsaceus JB14 TaxID=1447944 RepID=A0A6A4HF44_9AGAR|nr:hypothetical protein BT96DRAFT_941200 [Gymnopus androsaceus JB14]